MLISHRKKFIYTKTVKTAGTSVESYFEKYCMGEGEWSFTHARGEYVSEHGVIGYRGSNASGTTWRNHMPAAEIKAKVGQHVWNEYFKFCVVRNPFDKLVSGFHMFEKAKENRTTGQRVKTSIKKMLNMCEPIDRVVGKTDAERFKSWIKSGGWIDDRDKYLIGGEVCVDYFIRQENLEYGIRFVCEHLGLPFEPYAIPKLKSGIRPENARHEYWDYETVDIVNRLYSFEITKFNYLPPL